MPKPTLKRRIILDRPIQSRPSPVELDALQQYFAAEIADMLGTDGGRGARVNRDFPLKSRTR